MFRVVIDTSVLVSAFITKQGVSAALLSRGEGGAFALYLSREIIEETQGSLLASDGPRRSYGYTEEKVERFPEKLGATAIPVTNLPELRVVPLDPKDDVIVATAVKVRADYLITGDKRHLLPLREYAGTKIVSPRDMLDLLGARTG